MKRQGTDLPWSKLTEAQIAEIRRTWRLKQAMKARLERKYSAAALARRYGVGERHVQKIVGGEIWRHVE